MVEKEETTTGIRPTKLIFDNSEMPDYDKTIKVFEEGDVVSGSVVRIDRDEVLIDVGYKSEGVIPAKELDVRGNARPEDVVVLGQEIDALVLQKEDKEGRLILSRKRAEYEKAWISLADKYKSKELIEGRVIEVVKGGLILNIGLRGFLPASLVDLRRVKDLNQYLGQTLECRIIEMDRNRNNVVLSRRDALEDEQHDKRVKVLKNLKAGDFVTGNISSIVNFGAFVDLGGIDGLIHISELSWDHVNDPHDIVEVGEDVDVKILDIDLDKERISLGLKQTKADPWRAKADEFVKGSICKGTVIRVVPFGVFVRLADEVEGLVHVSEMSYQHIENPAALYNEGDEVDVKVADIDYDKHRIKLSIKATQPVPAPEVEAEEPEIPEPEQAQLTGTEEAEEARPEEEPSAEGRGPEIQETEAESSEQIAEPEQEPEPEISEQTAESSEQEPEPEILEPEDEEHEISEEEAEEVILEGEEKEAEEAVVADIEEIEVAEVVEEQVEPESIEEAEELEEEAEEIVETVEETPAEPELKESSEFSEEDDRPIDQNVSLESILEDMKKKSESESE